MANAFMLCGDEWFLIERAKQKIIDQAKQNGVEERFRFVISRGFNWGDVYAETQSLSLFGSNKLIELHFSNTPDKSAQTELQNILSLASSEQKIVATIPKLTPAQKKAKWFKACEQIASVQHLWPLKDNEYEQFLKKEFQQSQLQPTPSAVQRLAELTSGNAMAGCQAVEKLQLLNMQNATIDHHVINQVITDSARFNVFDLVDAVLLGKTENAIRITQGLEQTGVEPNLVLWALSKELRELATIQHKMQQGENLQTLLQKVWLSKRQTLQTFFRRAKQPNFDHWLTLAADIDCMIKGQAVNLTWPAIHQWVVATSNQTTALCYA